MIRLDQRLIRFLPLLGVALFLAACQPMDPQAEKPPAWTPAKVAVLPFQKVDPDAGQATARSPLTGSVFLAGRGVKGTDGLNALDAALERELHDATSLQLVPAVQTWAVYKEEAARNSGDPMRKQVAEAGRRLGADGVLVGHLYRLDQLEGGELSANRPASVAFDLAMVRVSDGAVVWKNSFDEAQKSLSEDILNLGQFLQHGIRWYSAEEYAAIGLSHLMQSFPWRKAGKGE